MFMTEIKTISGEVLFSFNEDETTLAKEIGWHKNLEGADLRYSNLEGANLRGADLIGADLFGAILKGANLVGTNLKDANITGSDLSGADLGGADLGGADLEDAILKGANLVGANLIYANLVYADLTEANLAGADLMSANITGANLLDADLAGADFWGADLEDAKNVPDIPLACPSEGSFVAWKIVWDFPNSYLVKLEIPADAKRSSATTKKCRCSKALVLDIENLKNGEHLDKVVNMNYAKCVYEVGKMVYPDSFDENRWYECSNGIHFFMDRQDAVDY